MSSQKKPSEGLLLNVLNPPSPHEARHFGSLSFMFLNQLVKIQETQAALWSPHSTITDHLQSSTPWTVRGAVGKVGVQLLSLFLETGRGCVCAFNLKMRWEVPFVNEGPKGLFPLLKEIT